MELLSFGDGSSGCSGGGTDDVLGFGKTSSWGAHQSQLALLFQTMVRQLVNWH